MQTHDSRGNDFRIAGVDVKQFVPEKYNRISQQRTSDDHAGFSQKYDSVDSLLFPCPVVLADKGKGGLIKGVHCHVHESFQIGSGRVSGNHDISENVDRGLDHHIGQCEYHALKSRRTPSSGNAVPAMRKQFRKSP